MRLTIDGRNVEAAEGMSILQAAKTVGIEIPTLCYLEVLTFLSGKKTLLRIKKANILSGLRLVPPCVALGASMFVMQASESVISVCFNSSLLKYGGDIAVGAMTILTSVMQFAMLPLQGIAQGAQPITSYNYGAKTIAANIISLIRLKSSKSNSVTLTILLS